MASLVSEGDVEDLRIPTVEFAAEVTCADGRRYVGRVFVPEVAVTHDGPMRAEEWINTSQAFFPFLEEGQRVPFLMNKRQIAVLAVNALADSGTLAAEGSLPARRVRIEVGAKVLEGKIAIEMPEEHARTLDFLNGPEAFLTLRDGPWHHLVQKKMITRIVEIREE